MAGVNIMVRQTYMSKKNRHRIVGTKTYPSSAMSTNIYRVLRYMGYPAWIARQKRGLRGTKLRQFFITYRPEDFDKYGRTNTNN